MGWWHMVVQSTVDLMVSWVTQWIDEQDPEALAAAILAETPITDTLFQRYQGWTLAFARGYLGPQGLATLRAAGPPEWTMVVDRLCVVRPVWGQLFWDHETWFHAQLATARDRFIAAT